MSVLAHKEQKRKCGDTPYVVHPIAVLSLLIKWEADEDTCIAGVLHDVLEDAPDDEKEMYRERIKEEFGPDVLAIVESVTEQDKSLPWKERKKQYLEHLKTASDESVLISCADMTHNLNSLVEAYREQGEDVWKHFNAIKQWKVWFIDRRVEMLKERLSEKYVKELCSHQTELNILIIQSASSGPLLRLEDENDEKAVFSCDPLYQELWDYCNLTEEEMESGVLDEDKRVMERASAATDEEDEDETEKPYKIKVIDNFHFHCGGDDDEDYMYIHGYYDTEEKAIDECETITIHSIMDQYEKGITPSKLVEKYKAFGSDPGIMSANYKLDDPNPFCAWEYVNEELCERIIEIIKDSPMANKGSNSTLIKPEDGDTDELIDEMLDKWSKAE
ncbi:MAG: HD domain-containing protein [bacterium]